MNLTDLYTDLVHVGTAGYIFNQQQLSAMIASLTLLQRDMKFETINLWGKILGLAGDYFIAEGYGVNEFEEKKYFYSKDCSHWKLLNPATDDVRFKALVVKGMLLGDPSSERDNKYGQSAGFVLSERKKDTPTSEPSNLFTIKEEDRLAGLIAEINHDVRIVPRGAYMMTEKGAVVVNRTFEGLSSTNATKLASYMHLRKPELLDARKLLLNANLDPSLDFMDTLDLDLPMGRQKVTSSSENLVSGQIVIKVREIIVHPGCIGCWSMQQESAGGRLVLLRSLLWPGYVFFHQVSKAKFGSLYIGSGLKNIDLPFML